MQAEEMLQKVAGSEGQRAWRAQNAAAFGDLVGRIAISQEEEATARAGTDGVVLFDRSVLDSLGDSLERGEPPAGYLTVEAAAQAVSRIDHVLVLDDLEERKQGAGRKAEPKAPVAMSAALEEVYNKLGCHVTRIAKGTVEERVDAALNACGLAACSGRN